MGKFPSLSHTPSPSMLNRKSKHHSGMMRGAQSAPPLVVSKAAAEFVPPYEEFEYDILDLEAQASLRYADDTFTSGFCCFVIPVTLLILVLMSCALYADLAATDPTMECSNPGWRESPTPQYGYVPPESAEELMIPATTLEVTNVSEKDSIPEG